MLGICAATRLELRPVLRAFRSVIPVTICGVAAWHGRGPSGDPALIFRTGVGLATAGASAERVLAASGVAMLINTGVAGGLVKGLGAGTVVIPDVILAPAGDEQPRVRHALDQEWVERLRSIGARAGLPVHPGPLVSSPTALASAAEKIALGQGLGAAAVEMEGSALALLSARLGVRFASVRVVLDDAETELPIGRAGPRTSKRREPRGLRKVSGFLTLARAFRTSSRALERYFKMFTKSQLG